MPDAAFAYAQPRLQARHARRLDAGAWRQLDSVAGSRAFLDALAGRGMSDWGRAYPGSEEPHEIEQATRRAWRQYAEEVADWLPEAWAEPVRALGAWFDLPVRAYLADHRKGPAWLHADPDFGHLLSEDAAPGSADTAEDWLLAWRHRLPRAGTDTRRGLDTLAAAIGAYFATLRGKTVNEPAAAVELEREVSRLLRKHALGPVAVVAHLALAALELERVRGGILRRKLFAGERAHGAQATRSAVV